MPSQHSTNAPSAARCLAPYGPCVVMGCQLTDPIRQVKGELRGERLTPAGALLCILNWLDATNLEAQRTAAVGVTAVLISTAGIPFFFAFDKFESWVKKSFTGAASVALQALSIVPLYAGTYYATRAIRRYMVDEDIMRPPKVSPPRIAAHRTAHISHATLTLLRPTALAARPIPPCVSVRRLDRRAVG